MAIISYNDIYDFDIRIMRLLNNEYEKEEAWNLLREFYKDPDGYPIDGKYRTYEGIKCTVDGLLSINRIYNMKDLGISLSSHL